MHIPDGFLSTRVWVPLAGASAVTVAVAARKAGHRLEDESIPLVGLLGAFVFALQMINFPVALLAPGVSVSDHIVGAGLLAIVFGPSIAILCMTAILAIQALVFADGGITALGANAFNMAIISVCTAWAIHRSLSKLMPNGAVAIATFAGVLLASTAAAVELILSLPFGAKFFTAMTGLHLISGVVEAMITVAVVKTLRSVQLIGKPVLEGGGDVQTVK